MGLLSWLRGPSATPVLDAKSIAAELDAALLERGWIEPDGMRQTKAVIPNQDPNFFLSVRLRPDTDPLTEPYRRHPWLYACLSQRARVMSQAALQVGRWEENADGGMEFVPDEDHPMVSLLERPNNCMTGNALWTLTGLYLDLFGEAFWVLDRDREDEVPARIWPVSGGRRWQAGPLDDTGCPIGWVLERNGEKIPYPRHQLVMFANPNPYNSLRGLSPIEPANVLIQSDVLADRYNREFFVEGAQTGGFLKVPHSLTPQQYQQIEARFASRHQGAGRAHRFGILEGNAEWIQTGVTQRDMEFIEQRRWTRTGVCAVYGWPEWMLTDESANFATAHESRVRLWQETAIPTLREREAALNTQLFSLLEDGDLAGRFNFDTVPALMEHQLDKWDIVAKMTKEGVSLKQANRILELGLTPEPGWDVPWKPTSMLPVPMLLEGPPVAEDDDGDDEADGADAPPPGTEPEPTSDTDDDADDQGGDEEPISDEGAAAVAGVLSRVSDSKQAAFKKRRNIWRRWMRAVRLPSEAAVAKVMRPYFDKYGTAVLRHFDRTVVELSRSVTGQRQVGPEHTPQLVVPDEPWDTVLATQMRPTYNRIAGLTASFTAGELGPHTEIDLLDNNVLGFINDRTKKVKGINDTVQRRLAEQLSLGFAENESLPELRARVASVSESLKKDPARVARIARTEAGVMANGIRFAILEQHADEHMWITADDEHVRAGHRAVDGKVVKVGEHFEVPNGRGGFDFLLFPQDPAGPPGQVINCRCLAEPIARGGVTA